MTGYIFVIENDNESKICFFNQIGPIRQTAVKKIKVFILMRAKKHLGRFVLMLSAILLTVSGAKKQSNSSESNNSNLTVYELIQKTGGDGLSGSFVIPENGVSFLLSIFLDNNNSVAFKSLTDPDGTDILSSSSIPNLYLDLHCVVRNYQIWSLLHITNLVLSRRLNI